MTAKARSHGLRLLFLLPHCLFKVEASPLSPALETHAKPGRATLAAVDGFAAAAAAGGDLSLLNFGMNDVAGAVGGSNLSNLTLAGIIIVSIIMLSISIGLIVLFVFKSGSAEPPAHEDVEAEVQAIEAEKASIKEQIDLLEQKMVDLRREAVKAQEDSRRMQAEAAVAAAKAAAAAAAGEVSEELHRLKEEAEEAARAAEEQIMKAEVTAEHLRELGEKAVAKTEEIKQMVVEGAEQTWQQLEAFVREAVKSLTSQMEEAFAAEVGKEDVESWAKAAQDVTAEAFSMPLPLLLAGLLAPMQLQWMASWNWSLLILQIPLLIICMMVIFVDRDKNCGGNELWLWIIVIAAMLKVSVTVRLAQMRSATNALAEAQAAEELRKGLFDDHPMHRLYRRVMTSSKDYFKLLLAYDGLARSSTNTLLSFISFVMFVWGGVGVYLVIAYAVEQETSCDAGALRFVSRMYAFFYVVALLWSVIALVIWILESVITSKSVALFVLQQAWKVDDLYSPSGFPVVSILVRALLLRSDKDMTKMEASILRGEIMELKEKKAELMKQEAALDSAIEEAQQHLQVFGKRQKINSADELAALYAKDLGALMDKIAIFVLAVQAQVKKLGPSAMDSLQAASDNLLEQAQSQAAQLTESTQRHAQELAEIAKQKAHEVGLDEISSTTLAEAAYTQSAHLREVAKRRTQEIAVAAQKAAHEAGLDEIDYGHLAQEAVGVMRAKVHETGLDELDYEKLAEKAKESAEQLARAALLKAREAGVDIEAIVMQVQSEVHKLAPEMCEKASQLAAEVKDEVDKLAPEVCERASQLAAEVKDEVDRLAPEVCEKASQLAAEVKEQASKAASSSSL